jgi:hypothetical protein
MTRILVFINKFDIRKYNSYAESNGGIFNNLSLLRHCITSTISYFTLQFSRFPAANYYGPLLDKFYIDMTPICFS